MKQALLMMLMVAAIFAGVDQTMGYRAAYLIGYGALTTLAVLISLTFLWLYQARATPLALGMSFSWAGAASVMGWWWLFNAMGQPAGMEDNALLLMFLSLYFVGAILHFLVVQRSMGLHRGVFLVPVAVSFLISAAVGGYL